MLYVGIGPEKGRIIDEDEALSYAMERCGIAGNENGTGALDADEFRRMLVDWFYSGNWKAVAS